MAAQSVLLLPPSSHPPPAGHHGVFSGPTRPLLVLVTAVFSAARVPVRACGSVLPGLSSLCTIPLRLSCGPKRRGFLPLWPSPSAADGRPVLHPPPIDGHAGESGRPLGLGNPPEGPPVPSLRGARGRYPEPLPARQGDVHVNGPVVAESPALLALTISKGPGTGLQLTPRSSLHLLSAGKPHLPLPQCPHHVIPGLPSHTFWCKTHPQEHSALSCCLHSRGLLSFLQEAHSRQTTDQQQ